MEPDLNAGPQGRGFLRRWFRRANAVEVHPREAIVVAFASGKGGTGKSFLATNTAIALHARGRRVALVDCDFGLANAHLLFGVNPRYSLQHLLEGGVPVQQVLTRTPYGPNLVAGGSGIASLAELDARHMQSLARAMHWIAANHDIVLLDCAAGLSPQSLIMVLAAQHVVVVTNPEIAALTDAYALIKCLSRQVGHPLVHLAVNRVGQPGLGKATFERLAEVSRRFAACEIHYLGEVPEDPQVTHRRLGQPPLLCSSPECTTTRTVMTMCETLDQRVAATRSTNGVEARMLVQIRRW
ncbi:MAG: P-loop NTPase [Planctomycetes bacterium]|nr:P-loop NTPase [Planctomycetota bacterium]